MSSKYCENCNNRVSDRHAKKCPKCGALLKQRVHSGQDKAAFIGFTLATIILLIVLSGKVSDFADERIQPGRPTDEEKSFLQPPENRSADKMTAVQDKEKKSADHAAEIELNYLKLEKLQPGKETDTALPKTKKSDLIGEATSKRTVENTAMRKIAKLEKEVKALPVSRISDNLRIYKQLSVLDPENLKYREKVAYYEMKQKKSESAKRRKGEFVIIDNATSASVLSYPVKGARLGEITGGKRVKIFEKQTAKNGDSTQIWFRVRFNESYGWICKNDTDGEIRSEAVIAEKKEKN